MTSSAHRSGLLTPALSSAAAISSSDAVFADALVPVDAVALPSLLAELDDSLLLDGAAAEGTVPHAASPRARTAAAQVVAIRAPVVVMQVSCSGSRELLIAGCPSSL
jgi:hypothetical protein